MSRKNKGIEAEEKADSVETPVRKKVYSLLVRENAPFECFVGGQKMMFRARGLNPFFPEKFSDGVPESIVNHPDFSELKKYFVITEKIKEG